jgi:hypothetical protein
MQTPLPGTYPVIQKNGSSALPDVFLAILWLKVQWLGPMLTPPKKFILLFQISLLDWKCWKINVKSCSGPLKGPPWGAKKRQKSVMQ